MRATTTTFPLRPIDETRFLLAAAAVYLKGVQDDSSSAAEHLLSLIKSSFPTQSSEIPLDGPELPYVQDNDTPSSYETLIVQRLCNISLGAKNSFHVNLAIAILAAYVKSPQFSVLLCMLGAEIPTSIKLLLSTSIALVKIYFPENNASSLDHKSPFVKTNFGVRDGLVSRCHVAQILLRLGERFTRSGKYLQWVDSVIFYVLKSSPHQLLEATILKLLSEYQITHRNRSRIELWFRVHVEEVAAAFMRQEIDVQADFQETAVIMHPEYRKWVFQFLAVWGLVPASAPALVVNLDSIYEPSGPFNHRLFSFVNLENYAMPPNYKHVDMFLTSKSQLSMLVASSDRLNGSSFIAFNVKKNSTLTVTRKHTLILQNKSQTKVSAYRIETSHPFLRVTEPIGILEKGASVPILISLESFGRSGDVQGWVRVRGSDGMIADRVSIAIPHPQPMSIKSSFVDFGFIPVDDKKSMEIPVMNTSKYDVSVVCILGDSEFTPNPVSIPLTYMSLKGLQSTFISVHFNASNVPTGQVFLQNIYVICNETQVHRLVIRAETGSALLIADEVVNFGLTDVHYGLVEKSIRIQNRSKSKLPVLIDVSSDELSVNSAEPIVLEPLETRRVAISYLPSLVGSRSEIVTFLAPNSKVYNIEVKSVAGGLLTCPWGENITFPVVNVNVPVTLHIPLQNLSTSGATFHITMGKGPMSFLLPEDSSETHEETEKDRKPMIEGDPKDIHVSIPPLQTTMLAVQLHSGSRGIWKSDMKITSKTSKAWGIQMSLTGIVAMGNDTSITQVEFVENALAGKAKISEDFKPPTDLLDGQEEIPFCFEHKHLVINANFINAPDNIHESPLMIKPSPCMLSKDAVDYAILKNTSSKIQTYSILFSFGIESSTPRTGSLSVGESLLIPMTARPYDELNPDFWLSRSDINTKTLVGCVTILAGDCTAISVPVFVVYGPLASIHSRLDFDHCKFPMLKPMEDATREFYLFNSSPNQISCEVKSNPSATLSAGNGQAYKSSGANFEVAYPHAILPWQFKPFLVTFHGSPSDFYSGSLHIKYTDPCSFVNGNDLYNGGADIILQPIRISCLVNKVVASFSEDLVVFEPTLISEHSRRKNSVKEIIMTNNSEHDVSFALSVSEPFFLSCEFANVKAKDMLVLHIFFAPTTTGQHLAKLSIVSFGYASTVQLSGIGLSGSVKVFKKMRPLLDPITSDPSTAEYQPAACQNLKIQSLDSFGTPLFELSRFSPTLPFKFQMVILNDSNCHYTIHSLASLTQTQSVRLIHDSKNRTLLSQLESIKLTTDSYERDEDEIKRKADSLEIAYQTGGRGRLALEAVAQNLSKSAFPISLEPHAFVRIQAIITEKHPGFYESVIQLNLSLETMSSISNQLVKFNAYLQQDLDILADRLILGTLHIALRKKEKLVFTNISSKPMIWRLFDKGTELRPHPNRNPDLPLVKGSDFNDYIHFFPAYGVLPPGYTQTVFCDIMPKIAEYYHTTTLSLRMSNGAESDIIFSYTGGVAKIAVEESMLDFGVVRVNRSNSRVLTIKNIGLLPCLFYIDVHNKQYSVDIEQGLLAPQLSMKIVVTLWAKVNGRIDSSLSLVQRSPGGSSCPPIHLPLIGSGGYSDLLLPSRAVDFGTAYINQEAIVPLKIENHGAAEGTLLFDCDHPCVRLQNSIDGTLIIAPNSSVTAFVAYTPPKLEVLNMNALLRNADDPTEIFIVKLKAKVGVPKLGTNPVNISKHLTFGVIKLHATCHRSFELVNDGNISLDFTVRLRTVNIEVVEISPELDVEEWKHISYDKSALVIEPLAGLIKVGEKRIVTVNFTPESVATYTFDLVIDYGFGLLTTTPTGVGGQAILKSDGRMQTIDFGTCRLNRAFKKAITFGNIGNLGMDYHARPEPADKDWSIYGEEMTEWAAQRNADKNAAQTKFILHSWASKLVDQGFSILNPDGICGPREHTDIEVEYTPTRPDPVGFRIRLYFGDIFQDIEIRAKASSSKLQLRDASNRAISTEPHNLGTHTVNAEYVHTIFACNEGPFPLDVFIQPMATLEFEVSPRSFFIKPDEVVPLKIFFRPISENVFRGTLKVMWDGQAINVPLFGRGGLGRLDINYADTKDSALKGLDFGMVPFESSYEKRFFLYNVGLVDVSFVAQVDNQDFSVTQLGTPFEAKFVRNVPPLTKLGSKSLVPSWENSVKSALPPGFACEYAAKFIPQSASSSLGNISLKSENSNFLIPLRGKGGTISISHSGDLAFGDIATNFNYQRKIVLVNSGSIAAPFTMEWSIVGMNTESSNYIRLHEVYSAVDPRSGWARQTVKKQCKKDSSDFTAKDYWHMIKVTVIKPAVKKEEVISPSITDSVLSESALTTPVTVRSRLSRVSAGAFAANLKKSASTTASVYFKRKQMFFNLISSTILSSQSSARDVAHLKVEPSVGTVASYGETVISIELNLASEATFLATLIVTFNVSSLIKHEIPLMATPKTVGIMCNDTRMLNFHRQPFGETEVIYRKFQNVGHKDISFKITNRNQGLTITPSKGTLAVGQDICVTFSFSPVDETVQTEDVIFEPDFSHPIRFKMFGGGGHVKVSLSRYRRFDFGQCMIGKDTVSILPIANEGNAVLRFVSFELQDSSTFFRGKNWPNDRVTLYPGKTFDLPLVFNPVEESPPNGKLTISTLQDTWEIELLGQGREAMLIISRMAVEFKECIVGNTYEQKVMFKNIGDVNYPVRFSFETPNPDLSVHPSSLVVLPYTECALTLSYAPSKELRHTLILLVESPYSSHKIPVGLHAGLILIQFDKTVLDFGMFEKSTRPTVRLTVSNAGTVKTNYAFKDSNRPPVFHIANGKGLLMPGKTTEILVTHVKHEVWGFHEKLYLRTDLLDKKFPVHAIGRCEETVLHPEEFASLHLGICPVMEPTTKPLVFQNYGGFPLTYSVKCSYPLKVSPDNGVIQGGQKGTINVTWVPAGGFELRSQVTIMCNIGMFVVSIRGKACFADILIRNRTIDFGVGAVDYSYSDSFTIVNKGRVPLAFSIPNVRDPNFSVDTASGHLGLKEEKVVNVTFKPSAIGRWSNSFQVESKGVAFKEITVIGTGGLLKYDIIPHVLDLGRCPCELKVASSFILSNLGDVPIHTTFRQSPETLERFEFFGPPMTTVRAGISSRIFFDIIIHETGIFDGLVELVTREKVIPLKFTVCGVRITLAESSKEIIQNEKLPVVLPKELSINRVTESGDLDTILHRFEPRFIKDVKIANYLSEINLVIRSVNNGIMTESSGLQTLLMNGIPDVKGNLQALPRVPSMVRNSTKADARQEILSRITLRNGKLPAADVVDLIYTDFVRLKSAEHMLAPVIHDEDDFIMKDFLDYGPQTMLKIDLGEVLEEIEPAVDEDLGLIIGRPPPFGHYASIQDKRQGAIRFGVYPHLERRQRNAKTVDSFREFGGGTFGVGVQVYRPTA